jgi:transcriptional regulator
MHLPKVNAVRDPKILHQFIRQNPLGILTTAVRSENHPFLQASHIPWVLDTDWEGNTSGLGRLRGHIARQNPQSKAIIEQLSTPSQTSATSHLSEDVLILFNGPVHHYVTPKFYLQTKPETGKVVPTWDYEAVEVYGKARIFADSKASETRSFLAKQIDDLSDCMETSVMGHTKENGSEPWKVADAPERYVELLMTNIIGIEIEITNMGGRFKWSQEKPEGDRAGVIEGFRNLDKPEAELLSRKASEQAKIFDAEKGS